MNIRIGIIVISVVWRFYVCVNGRYFVLSLGSLGRFCCFYVVCCVLWYSVNLRVSVVNIMVR